MKQEILNKLNLGEDHERECKLATGGLPESTWETYSSFANTNGGTILLGIKEHRDSFTIEGLTDKQIVKYQKDFWSTLNDRNKVSKNILLNHHVQVVEVEDKKILKIDIPAADRHDKPVYIGTDPMKGTYKRDYEGDFICTEEAVRAMFADQRDVSGDVEVLDELGLDVLDQDTVKGYRIVFEQLHSGHPWNALENDEFLMKLRAAAKNKNGTLSPTIAGLLFFGEAYHITEVFPNYFLDYREECDDKAVRWLFRTHSNEGDWSGNIYDFFCKVRTRMDDDVAVPFANRRDGYRVDRVDVHDALEEALANALAHANYYGRRGILVVKKGKKPEFDFSERNDRVTLKLEVGQVVYIPEAVDLQTNRQSDSTEADEIRNMNKGQRVMHYLKNHDSISTQQAMEPADDYMTADQVRMIVENAKQEIKYINDISLDGGCDNLEFNRSDATKAAGLQTLAVMLGIPMNETLSNNEDGVAVVLERIASLI